MPNEFGYPGIPTSRQNTNANRFDNSNLSQRKKLSIDFEQPSSPSLAALYEDEPSVEELLAEAQGTLDDTAPMANVLRGSGLQVSNPADDAAAAEQGRTERLATREYRNAALSPLMATSFVPGPVGFASQGVLGAAGAMDAADSDLSTGERVMGGMGAALTALPSIAALRRGSALSKVDVGMHGPANAATQGAKRGPMPYKFNGLETPPAPQRQLGSGQKLLAENNVLEGEVLPPLEPRQLGPGARQLPRSTEPDPSFARGIPAEYAVVESPSMAALTDEGANADLIGEIDLSSAINSLSEAPLSPQAIAQARAAERFGRSFRSERTVPQARYAGKQEALTEGDQPFDMFELETSPGQFSTGATADDLAAQGVAIPSTGQPASVDQSAFNRLVSSLFGDSPSPATTRQSARQAVEVDRETLKKLRSAGAIFKGDKKVAEQKLEKFAKGKGGLPPAKDEHLIQGMPASDWTDRVFGGIGGFDETGEFVRPSARTPIGAAR